MSTPITLVAWFDAKDNPPDNWRQRMTDQGYGVYEAGRWRYATSGYMLTQPSVWCDPSPPDMSDPLTVEDLRAIAHAVLTEWHLPAVGKAAKRLRRALDQI